MRFIFLTIGISALGLSECRAQYFTDSSTLEGGLAGDLIQAVKEHKNRTVYTSLTASIIDSLPDEKLSQVVADHVRSKMDKQLSNEYEVLKQEPEAGKAIYIISQVEAEVNNGGFAQFFSSSAAKLQDETEGSFKAIHANLFAGLMKRAIILYQKEGISQNLKKLDEEFYSLYDREDLDKLKIRFIRRNKSALNSN